MPALRVDPLLSYARRVEGSIQVVLDIEGDRSDAEVALRLLGGGDVLDVPATVEPSGPGRSRVEAVVPADQVGGHTRRMKLLDPPDGEPRNLQTRLMVRDGMPVALLPGRAPDTQLREPQPRSGPATSPSPARRPRARSVPGVGRLRRRRRGGA